ncbi:MAG: hypothetical protein LBD24_09120 [Spirochaetaceae bacterium]|jgi:hypothetical protein|nr:hypothetical protein [Spirochaetaceae bacterium]
MKHGKRLCTPLALVLAAALSSCIGVRADIVMKSEGAGTIALEYRLSKLAESLGKLDGNERWPTVPLGRGDFERTAARVEGLTLRSFSTKEEGADVVTKAVFDFSGPEALARFLDAGGKRAVLTREPDGRHRLFLSLTSGRTDLDPDLREVFVAVSAGYDFALTLRSQREGTLTLHDATGAPCALPPEMRVVPSGTTVSFKSPVGLLFSLAKGASLALTW